MSKPDHGDTLEGMSTLADLPSSPGIPATRAVEDVAKAEPETLDAPTADASFLPSSLQTVDRSLYVVHGEIAAGGMGVVLRARDTRTGRAVALKELLGNPRPRSRRRFEREARITAQLQHPSIVPVYEVGQWPDERPFFAMKLVGGRPLDEVADEALNPEARLALVTRILPAVDAIAYAHENRVIHRDLKPANVLLGEFGETIVIDWGLAKGISDPEDTLDGHAGRGETVRAVLKAAAEAPGEKLTVDGVVIGTPAYMPPEQARAEPLDARADVYALGALLYHALSGQAPYDGNMYEVIMELLEGPPTPLSEVAAATPPDLVSIVEKAMARERDDRYANASELARDLDAFLTGRLVGAYRYTSWELLRRFVVRNKPLVAALASLVVLATVSVGFVARAGRISDQERARAVAAEDLALEREREAHDQLAQAHWRNAVRHLQDGDHLGAEILAAAALVESPDHPRGPHYALRDGAASRLAGPGATWSAARTLRFARHTRDFVAHTDWLYDVVASRDGNWLITTAADHSAIIWSLRTGEAHRVLTGHGDTVFQAALDASGTRVATSSYDGTIRLWAFPDGALLRTLEHPSDRVYGVCFTPDGALHGAGADGTIVTFDATTGSVQRTMSVLTAIPWRLSCSQTESLAVLGSVGGEAVVLDLAAGTVVHRLNGSGGAIEDRAPARTRAVLLTPDDTQVIIADEEGELRRYDRESGVLRARSLLEGAFEAVAMSPDGRWLALGADEIIIVDADTLRPVARLDGHDAGVVALSFGAHGQHLFSGSDDQRVVEWTLPREREGVVFTLPGRSRLDVIVPSSDGRFLVAGGDDAAVHVWDTRAGGGHDTLTSHTAPVRGAAFVSARRVATTGMDRTLWLHDLSTRASEQLDTLPHFGDEVVPSPDGSTLALALGDGQILLRGQAGATRSLDDAHAERAFWLAFSPDGHRLASADFGGMVALTDPVAGTVLRRWRAHEARIYDGSWRPDGGELTTVGLEGWLRGWSLEGEPLRAWRVLDGEVCRSVAWSPDGAHLLVTTDGGARVFSPDGALEARLDLPDRTTAGAWMADGRMLFSAVGYVYALPLDLDDWQENPADLLANAERAAGTTLDELIVRSAGR